MAKFNDNTGAEWTLAITYAEARSVKQELGYSLQDEALKNGLLQKLLLAPDEAGDLLWVLFREQAQARGLDERDFFRRLGGDALGDCLDCVVDAVIDFFPSAELRRTLTRLRETIREGTQRAAMAATTALYDPEVEAAMQRMETEIREASRQALGAATAGASSSPAPAASSPGPSASASSSGCTAGGPAKPPSCAA